MSETNQSAVNGRNAAMLTVSSRLAKTAVSKPDAAVLRRSPRLQTSAGTSGPRRKPNQLKLAIASSNHDVVMPQPISRVSIPSAREVEYTA